MTYTEAREKAQARANELGYDHGVEEVYDGYTYYMLPAKSYRYGHELRCEVVHPENLANCKPGHGPCAVDERSRITPKL